MGGGIPYEPMTKKKSTKNGSKRTKTIVVKEISKKSLRVRRPKVPRGVPLASDAHMYIAGLLNGDLCSSTALPCTDAHAFRELTVHHRIAPVVGSDGTVVLVFNPMYMWASFGIEAQQSGAGGHQQIQSIFQGQSLSTFVPGSPTGSFTSGPPGWSTQGTIDTGSNNYSGRVRFLGAKVRFSNTQTVLNTGGQLFFVHNPQSRSLIYCNSDATAGTLNLLSSVSPSTTIAGLDTTSFHPVGMEPLKFVMLPHTHEFEQVNTDRTVNFLNPHSVDPELVVGVSNLQGVVPDQPLQEAHQGWTQALIYAPANTIASGNSAQCLIEIECHYHVNVDPMYQSGTAAAAWGTNAAAMLSNRSVSNPQGAAAVSNALGEIKYLRSQDSGAAIRPDSREPSALAQFAKGARTVYKAARPFVKTGARMLGAIENPVGTLLGTASKMLGLGGGGGNRMIEGAGVWV